jgi:hypothetical protein
MRRVGLLVFALAFVSAARSGAQQQASTPIRGTR